MSKYKYYKTKYKRLSPNDVFVALNDYEYYCPIGQHGTMSRDYLLNDTKEITLQKYLEVTKGLYTPKEYIQNNQH